MRCCSFESMLQKQCIVKTCEKQVKTCMRIKEKSHVTDHTSCTPSWRNPDPVCRWVLFRARPQKLQAETNRRLKEGQNANLCARVFVSPFWGLLSLGHCCLLVKFLKHACEHTILCWRSALKVIGVRWPGASRAAVSRIFFCATRIEIAAAAAPGGRR